MIYFVFTMGFLLALAAEKKNSFFFVICLIFLLGGFVGLRSRSVGIDTDVYYQILTNVQMGVFSSNVEIGFLGVCWILLKVFSVEQVILIFSLLTEMLIVCRLWSMRKQHSFSLMTFLFMITYYSETANIMRQYLAIALIFYGTSYLDQKRYFRFLILLIIATSFHYSSIIAILYIPLYAMFSDVERIKRNKAFLVSLISLPVVVGVGGYVILGKYGDYLSSSNSSFGWLQPLKLVLACFFCLVNYGIFNWYRIRKRYLSVNNGQYYLTIEREPNTKNFNTIALCYIMGVGLTCLGYINSSLYRIGLLFQPFEFPFVASAFKYKHNSYFFKLVYIVLFLFIAYNNSTSWSGLSEYTSWLIHL